MAKTANLYARIEPDVKEQAEIILDSLGIPASNAISMFYKQIILNKRKSKYINTLEKEIINSAIEKKQLEIYEQN